MSFNITGALHYSPAEGLYANTDFSSLTWAEKQWAGWYILLDNPVVATGLMSFLLHEVGAVVYVSIFYLIIISPCQFVYFGRALPWIIIDAIPYFRRWKLQPGKVPSPQEQWECTKQVLLSHFTIELPAVGFVSASPL